MTDTVVLIAEVELLRKKYDRLCACVESELEQLSMWKTQLALPEVHGTVGPAMMINRLEGVSRRLSREIGR